MIYLQRIAIAALGCCLLGCQKEPEATELTKLTADDTSEINGFGKSVAISGNTAIVGTQVTGSAYLFDVNTGERLFRLRPSYGATGDMFGWSVAISGDTAIVGAVGDDNGEGLAYLFDVNTGEQLLRLTASDAAAGDVFGNSVAISGNIAIVGAYHDGDRGCRSGSAYVFTAEP